MTIGKTMITNGFMFNLHDGHYGIEIETEAEVNYPIPRFKFWKSEGDGSLRHFGVEYILKSPLKFPDQVGDALSEFREKLKDIKFLESPYTSVHVHVNMLNEEWKTLANFVTAYSLLENLLTRYSGPDRVSNLFCLPIKDSEGCLQIITDFLKNIDTKKYNRLAIDEGAGKYAALNFASFCRLGTLEVRTFRGSSDVDAIMRWVSILDNMMCYARSKIDPVKIVSRAFEDPYGFLSDVFGEGAALLYVGGDPKPLILRNLIYGAKIASCSKNWDTFGVIVPKKIPKELLKSHLDQLAMQMFNKPRADLQIFEDAILMDQFNLMYNPGAAAPLGEDL